VRHLPPPGALSSARHTPVDRREHSGFARRHRARAPDGP
jgi:hypothetical protein